MLNGLRWLFVLAALVTGGSAVFVYLALYLVLPWSDRPVKAARHGERRGTVGFAGRLVLWLVLAAAVWAYMGSRLVGLYSQLGMALGPAAKWSMVSLQFLLYSPTGWVLLGLSFAALVGVRRDVVSGRRRKAPRLRPRRLPRPRRAAPLLDRHPLRFALEHPQDSRALRGLPLAWSQAVTTAAPSPCPLVRVVAWVCREPGDPLEPVAPCEVNMLPRDWMEERIDACAEFFRWNRRRKHRIVWIRPFILLADGSASLAFPWTDTWRETRPILRPSQTTGPGWV